MRQNLGIEVFAPPYSEVAPLLPKEPWPNEPATHLIWRLNGLDFETLGDAYELLEARPPEFDLVIVLPPPTRLEPAVRLFPVLPSLTPVGILPHSVRSQERVKLLLQTPPPHLEKDVVRYMIETRFIGPGAADEVLGILEAAQQARSVARVAMRMGTSRRTLGRHMEARGLPSPSKWIQLARLLHACLRLQHRQLSVSRVAQDTGYPDPFTLSNQMKRVLGLRPSEARQYMGWKWAAHRWKSSMETPSMHSSFGPNKTLPPRRL